jgi:ribosomal protein S18 acetylase RimI-like enzyme
MIELILAQSEDDLLAVRKLFVEYAEALGFDLCFQGFREELDGLPGAYAAPDGRLFLAFDANQAVGCVAIRKLEDGICEMKRLYLRPSHRGHGVGHRLAKTVIEEARNMGYEKMRLDSLASMKEAVGLYRSLGFSQIPPYRHNPLPGPIFMELML